MIKKTALVTGGAGFIGSHMVDLLIKKNFNVIVIDNLSGGHKKNLKNHLKKSNFKFLNKDICTLDINSLNLNKLDYIFHFAGKGDIVPSIQNPFDYFLTNVIGTIKILEIAKKYKVKKFVYAASSSCYGLAKTPTKESHKINPLYPYALSKYMGEQAALHWKKLYNLKVNSIRIFNAYGPRVRTTGAYGAVFGVFFKQKLSNKPYTLVGNGRQKRDFLHVKDVVNAFYLAAIRKKIGEVYNLGAGKPKTIKSLVKLLKGRTIKIPKRPGEPDCTWANINKIKKELNWEPKISFEDGVRDMLTHIKDWDKAPLWNPKNIKKATKDWFAYMKK